MKKRILRYLKHLLLTCIVILCTGMLLIVYENGSVHYADNPQRMNWHNEGPYLFYDNDSTLSVNHIQGDHTNGFFVKQTKYNTKNTLSSKVFFNLDSTSFQVSINPKVKIPKAVYADHEPVIAISDIESGYKTFRDFLIAHHVIDKNLNWTFNKGHLVLLGDFVDRGFSTTQVLWFIYKLEQEATKYGGTVHFILGNHELKNLQGDYNSASEKYHYVAAIMEKQQFELYNSSSFIGKWMASKNTLEVINDHLFVHGGIHPKLATFNTNIHQINNIVRKNYALTSFPKPEKTLEQFLISRRTGPSWYRGYFKNNLSEEEITAGLDFFKVKAVVVGHTIQRNVEIRHHGKVISIDVVHPKDYHKNWPNGKSEGLLIENGTYFRLLHTGRKISL